MNHFPTFNSGVLDITITPENWEHIRARREFQQRYFGRIGILGEWIDSDLYVVRGHGYPYPLLVWWKGIWFVREVGTAYTAPADTIGLSPAVPTFGYVLYDISVRGKPDSDLMLKAAKLGVLPDDVVAKIAAARIGVAP